MKNRSGGFYFSMFSWSVFSVLLKKFIWLAAGKSVKSAGTQPLARVGTG
jgi:hypothetical protein